MKLNVKKVILKKPSSSSLQVLLASFLILLTMGLHATAAYSQDDVYDPWEPVNRGTFWFNDQADIFVLEPVARGYDYVMPEFARTGVGNFFENLNYPKYLVSDLVQLKFEQVVDHTGRFLINTTIGLLGLFDVASEFGIERHEEDFGIALAYQGVDPGPYVVLPLLGPSNVRDTTGKVVDFFLNPFTIFNYASKADTDTKFAITLGGRALEVVDTRAGLLEGVKTAKESSVDYYFFVQGAYNQYRRGLLYDGNPPDSDEFGTGNPLYPTGPSDSQN